MPGELFELFEKENREVPSGARRVKSEVLIAVPEGLLSEIHNVLDQVIEGEDCICSELEGKQCFLCYLQELKERIPDVQTR